MVDIRIGHPPDAHEDQDRCDRREYWLVGPASRRLVAVDCEEQWGADSQGPADTVVTGTKLSVRYVEHGSSDTCGIYAGTVDLVTFQIESERRLSGEALGHDCVNQRIDTTAVPPGDGSPGRPLVTLR